MGGRAGGGGSGRGGSNGNSGNSKDGIIHDFGYSSEIKSSLDMFAKEGKLALVAEILQKEEESIIEEKYKGKRLTFNPNPLSGNDEDILDSVAPKLRNLSLTERTKTIRDLVFNKQVDSELSKLSRGGKIFLAKDLAAQPNKDKINSEIKSSGKLSLMGTASKTAQKENNLRDKIKFPSLISDTKQRNEILSYLLR